MDRLPFEASPGLSVPLSISAGVAVFPQDGESYETLLAIADSRMYRDKSLRKHNPTRQLGAGPATADSTDQPGRASGTATYPGTSDTGARARGRNRRPVGAKEGCLAASRGVGPRAGDLILLSLSDTA